VGQFGKLGVDSFLYIRYDYINSSRAVTNKQKDNKEMTRKATIYQVKIQPDFHPERLAATIAYNTAIREEKRLEQIACNQNGENGTLEALIEAGEVLKTARSYCIEMEEKYPTRAEQRKEAQIMYDNSRGLYHYGMR
jgi:hypothetical protein